MIDKRERVYQAFAGFISRFVRDLNHRADADWAVLVEGKRDERALRDLGYRGPLATIITFSRLGRSSFGDATGVVILTDLDREGGVLAGKFARRLRHDGLRASLAERRRLSHASRGVFLHIENLGRFAGLADPVSDYAFEENQAE